MHALTWTRTHLPLHHAPSGRDADRHVAGRRWPALLLLVMAGYVGLVGLLLASAWAVFGMDARSGWAFSVAVASYVLLFSSFITGLAWCVSHNRCDRPDRC